VRALFLTTVLPRGGASGGEIVSQSIVEALQEAGRVTTLGYRRPTAAGPSDAADEVAVGSRPIETSEAGVRALAWAARALARRRPYSCAKYESRGFLRAVAAHMHTPPALVFIDHAQIGFTVNALGRERPPMVFIAHNVEADTYARLAAQAGGPGARWLHSREAKLVGEVERSIVRQASQVWTLTNEDAETFRMLVPGAHIRVLEACSRALAPPAVEPVHDLGLIGTWSWRPNGLGLRWFVDEVIPHLDAQLKIEIAGRGAEWLRGRFSNVHVRGVVPEALEFLSQSRVVAVPSVAGSGVQIKTLDAIASGVPVVATPVAVRGLDPLPSSVAVAERPEDFARELHRLAVSSQPETLRAEALSWSAARRARFVHSVTSWSAELIGGNGARAGVTEPAT
jgi:glycosyltransferase involved in cell wall biosynthesis